MDNNILEIDTCVIGAGVSGLFISSKFLSIQKKVLLVEESIVVGGQINLYKEKMIYNIPLIKNIKSNDVKENLFNEIQDNENLSLHMHSSVVDITKNDDKFIVNIIDKTTKKETKYICKYVVIASGKGIQKPNKLQIDGCEKFESKTLLYSIDNKEIFKGKNVVLAGGGDSIIDWSCELVDIVKSITVLHRRQIERLENPQFLKFKKLCEYKRILTKIPYSILKLNGEDGAIKDIEISNNETGEEENLKCDYLLPFYGLKTTQKNLDLYEKLGVKVSNNGIVVNSRNNQTSAENIFAVGDCCCFDGKISNIVMGFNDCLRCFYEICSLEHGKVDFYGHSK